MASASRRLFFNYNSAVPTVRRQTASLGGTLRHLLRYISLGRLAAPIRAPEVRIRVEEHYRNREASGRALSSFERTRLEELFSEQIEQKLDTGAGSCLLANAAEEEFYRTVTYILDNPKKAGLRNWRR